MIAAYELAVFGSTEMTGDVLLDDWSGVGLDTEAVMVCASDGTIAAAGHLYNRADITFSVYGYVHPAHRDIGLGTFLVQWSERWAHDRMQAASADARIVVRHFLALPDESARRLLDEHGYLPGRGFYVMAMDLDDEPVPPEWPEGIFVRTFNRCEDEQATFETYRASFRDHWSPPTSYESFLQKTESTSFDPGLWYLAMDGDEIAGVCFSKLIDGAGWIDDVGVRQPWRRRGVGLALLRHAFGELYRRGAVDVGLSVDAESLTGAPRLYERAGMHVKRGYVLYQKLLQSGEGSA